MHKNQEWFRLKYHPVDAAQRIQLANQSIKRRCDVFVVMKNHRKKILIDLD
jgi:hypothetical protein